MCEKRCFHNRWFQIIKMTFHTKYLIHSLDNAFKQTESKSPRKKSAKISHTHSLTLTFRLWLLKNFVCLIFYRDDQSDDARRIKLKKRSSKSAAYADTLKMILPLPLLLHSPWNSGFDRPILHTLCKGSGRKFSSNLKRISFKLTPLFDLSFTRKDKMLWRGSLWKCFTLLCAKKTNQWFSRTEK